MTDIVERLRGRARGYRLGGPKEMVVLLDEAADEITRLRAENFSLAAWQCEFTDGKTGLVAGEGGSTYCAMAQRVERLRAALREITECHMYSTRPWDIARAALEQKHD